MLGKETVTGIRQRDNHCHLAKRQSLVLGKETVTGIRQRDNHWHLAKRQSLAFGKETVTGIWQSDSHWHLAKRESLVLGKERKKIITGYIRRGGRRELRCRARIGGKVNAKH